MNESKIEEFVAVGRRKAAVAKVRLSKGSGVWVINGETVERAKLSDEKNALLMKPFCVVGDVAKFNFRAFISGGGYSGQTAAIVLGLARALEKMNPEWRSLLKTAGLLTRDSRSKERKKPGQPKARKRFQFSKR